MKNEPPSAFMEQQLARLGEVLPAHKRVWIIPHDYPDPDALAAAAAFHLLLAERYHVASRIVFTGEVSRAENKELLRRFKFRWHLLGEARLPRRSAACIFVDTAPWSRNVTIPPLGRPVAVIDHHQHKIPERWKGLFLDIRSGAGATTTIAHEYLKAAALPVPRWLAAIMAYALQSETQDLSRDADRADLDAYVDMAGRADLKIVGRIRHAPLPRAYFARLQEALTRARRWDNLVWTHLRRTEHPEIIAEVADLLLRMEGTKWSFCTANLNGRLFVSLRSNRRGARCSQMLRSVIGRDGSAGGHHRMAAGFINCHDLSRVTRENRRLDLERALIRRILRKPAEDLADIYPLGEALVER